MTLQIQSVFEKQKEHALLLRTERYSQRKQRLEALRNWILKNREHLYDAVDKDMGKPPIEFYGVEILYVLNEIKSALKNLDKWVRPKKIDAPIDMLGTRSKIMYEPRGVCLIIAPWNYPFSLCIGPLVSALAAGNTIIIKPSEFNKHVSAAIAAMVKELFDEKVVAVAEGGVEVSQELLALPFDHIFFTGSTSVGKLVMKAAAENLASVTLELGGKSPAIVTGNAHLEEAAERIVIGKFVNAGQTCTAPDYVLVHNSVADKLVEHIIEKIGNRFADKAIPLNKPSHYTRIVSHKHFDRLVGILDNAVEQGAIINHTGNHDRDSRLFYPTVITNVSAAMKVMQEEIFGPILPIVTYETLEEAIDRINQKPKPLGLYVFTKSRSEQNLVLKSTSAGGVCVNDCAIHFLQHRLPFGGVNSSGMGKAHEYAGFLTFSNEKPVLRQRSGLTSVQALYPPYTKLKDKIVDFLFRLF